ncbi:MAG: hypothetical protein PHX43_08965 [Alphaproteobacteria bacterium]|nr:hypothetical protein [Alphaproteobacteria bacterium]
MVISIDPKGKATTQVNPDGSITITIPVKKDRKGERAMTTIVAPDGTKQKQASLRKLEQDYLAPIHMTAMISVLVRAHQWKEEIMSGEIQTLSDIAIREKIDVSYVSRVYRLTLLAPDIVEAILTGTHPKTLTQLKLLKQFPMLWSAQREYFGFNDI